MELIEEISRGMPVEELRSKLTEKPEVKSGSREEKTHRVQSHKGGISDDLVQIQAFIRWEKAGKPNYPPEKQLVMFLSMHLKNLFLLHHLLSVKGDKKNSISMKCIYIHFL